MRKNYKTLLAFILFLSIIYFSCSDKKETDTINKENYRYQLESLRERKISAHYILKALNNYIDLHKEQLYVNNEAQFLYDKGMIYLFLADFLQSFIYFKKYIAVTGDKVLPYYMIGKSLSKQNSITGQNILILSAKEAKDDISKFADYQQFELLLHLREDFFLYFNKDDFYDSLKDSKMYDISRKVFSAIKDECKSYNSRYIQNLSRCEYFDPNVINEIEKKEAISVDEIDFLITYYLKPATFNNQKALFWIKKRNFKLKMTGVEYTGHSKTVFVLEQIMKGWLANNYYDEVIQLYNNADLLTDTKKSQHHIYLLVSAGYAGKGDFDSAIKYLELEFENTQVFDIPETADVIVDYSSLTKGDMVYALFLMIHVIDEFDALLKEEKYTLIKEIVEKNINRYKDLKVFQPESWEPVK